MGRDCYGKGLLLFFGTGKSHLPNNRCDVKKNKENDKIVTEIDRLNKSKYEKGDIEDIKYRCT